MCGRPKKKHRKDLSNRLVNFKLFFQFLSKEFLKLYIVEFAGTVEQTLHYAPDDLAIIGPKGDLEQVHLGDAGISQD